jgi:hypothetical protein
MECDGRTAGEEVECGPRGRSAVGRVYDRHGRRLTGRRARMILARMTTITTTER